MVHEGSNSGCLVNHRIPVPTLEPDMQYVCNKHLLNVQISQLEELGHVKYLNSFLTIFINQTRILFDL